MDHIRSHRHVRPGANRSFSAKIVNAPETARFLRRAAPAFFRELSKEYKRETAPAPHLPQPASWPDTGLHAAWLGHSTTIMQVDGFTMLTDPVFSCRVGLNIGPLTIGIKRLVDVAAPVTRLPHVDLILLSHAHMDHFDLPSLRSLENPATQVITAQNTSDLIRVRRYGGVHELRWGHSVQAGPAKVTAFRVAHWGARMRSDTFRGYNAYLIEIGRYRIVFGGDTAYTDAFRKMRSQHAVDLAIMPVGAYDPWIAVHCNPEQALAMANDVGAEFVLPVHHQTFQLSREPHREPIERLLTAAGGESHRVCLQEIGQDFHLQR